MAANSVDSPQYVDGSIDTAHIGADQITTLKLLMTKLIQNIMLMDLLTQLI